MNDTLLCQTLQAFSKAEHEQLGQALSSPLFSPSRLAPKCVELHQFFIQKGFDKELSYEEAFAILFPRKAFNKALLENIMSALMDAIREFVAWRQVRLRNGEVGCRLEMARFYRERNLDQRFQQTIMQLKRQLKKQGTALSAEAYFQEFEVEMELYSHLVAINDLQNDLNLPASADSFIQYIFTKGLELALRLDHQATLTAFKFSQHDAFLKNLRVFATESTFFQNPLIELLCLASDLLDGKTSEVVFNRFVSMLQAEGHRMQFGTYHFLSAMARHYCLSKINHGEPVFRPVLLELYKTHLTEGLLYEKGKILHNTLLNMVNMAIGENESDWAAETLESHRHRIMGIESEAASYYFIKAFLAFNRKDFSMAALALDEAFSNLNQVEARSHFKDFNLKLMARKLEIQILYESDPASSLLADRLNAHKMFIHRNRFLTPMHKTLHNNFIDLMKQLTLPANQNDPKRVEKIYDKLSRPGLLIADRKWVTEKVQALME